MINFKITNLFSLILLLGFSLVILTSTQATAGSVTNEGTNISYTDLQAAIDAANSGDSLVLSGTFTGSFIISSKSLSLRAANGYDSAFLDGGGVGRVLEMIGDSPTKLITVNLESLILQNGVASDDSSNGGNGGGILGVYVDFQLIGTVVQNNSAAATGGGIAVLYSQMYMFGGVISNNKAATGGGINILRSTAQIIASIINENSDSQAGGGGILSNESTLFLEDSAVVYNTSQAFGGGIYNSTGSKTTIKLTDNNLSGIKLNQASLAGAGIYNAGTLTVDGRGPLAPFGFNISSNITSYFGGGLYIASSAKSTDLINCYITNNTATFGGGIYNAADPSKLSTSNTEVIGNHPDNIAP